MLYRPRSLKSWQGLLGARLPTPTLKGPRSLRPGEGEGQPRELDVRGATRWEADLGGGPLFLPMSPGEWGLGVGVKGP